MSAVLSPAAGGPAVAPIPDPDLAPYFNQIYAGTSAAGDAAIAIVDNLQDYNDWTFDVQGVDADDDLNIQISLDGVTWNYITLVNVQSGATVVQAAGVQIEVAGLYKIAMGGGAVPLQSIRVRALKVVRVTATGSNAVTVQASGGWGAT